MADIDNTTDFNVNSTDLSDNFNTIKTLLNSIRAQGILNTSDVDKLLSGINEKLEKLNTDEDIDMIKIFLSELKQNFEERHGVIISKFSAIESLFSNLLKNSNDLPKSSDVKEMFDIVATNLSVFSREVVSQKDALKDIELKIDSIRSDDSDKKDIIKNITLLKPDLERLNNGFDTIVLSLNDNFKTIVKTITTIDKTEYLDKFSDTLSNIEMSSNTVLSALQMLDRKAEQVDERLQNLSTKEDINAASQKLYELSAQSLEISGSVNNLAEKYVRVENLADKVDASVNIIANLKSMLTEHDDKNTKLVLDDLNTLSEEVKKITSDTKFEEFKSSLESVLNNISENSSILDKNLTNSMSDIENIISLIKALDLNANFQSILTSVANTEANIKSYIDNTSSKQVSLNEANITRVLNDIATSADSLNNRLSQTQSEMSVLYEKNFGSVFESISDLKNVVSQIDDNAISANNAIFSNISDRLSAFENMLKVSLENQERSVTDSSAKLVDHIEDIKNLSGSLDYKMDSSVLEVGNVKREFEDLKSAVNSVLALDFVSVVKDLRADLYASKQDMANSFEGSRDELSERISKDLYSKYELLISKLDSVEDEFKKAQVDALSEFKPLLDNISSSIVDVLSYVSEIKNNNTDEFDSKLNDISSTIKETNMNYVESVRDIVDVIRIQVDNNLKNIEEDSVRNINSLKETINSAVTNIKSSVDEIIKSNEDNYSEFKNVASTNAENIIGKLDSVIKNNEDNYSEFKNVALTNAETIVGKIDGVIRNNEENLSEFRNVATTNAKNITDKIDSVIKNNEENLSEFKNVASTNAEMIKTAISTSSGSVTDAVAATETAIKNDLKYSYSKLLEIQDAYNELKDLLGVNQVNSADKLEGVITATFGIRDEFESKMSTLKMAILDKMTEFKQDFVNDNQNKTGEIRVAVEKLNNLNSDEIKAFLNDLKEQIGELSSDVSEKRATALATILDNFAGLKEFASALNDKYSVDLTQKVNELIEDFGSVKAILNKVDDNVDSDMTRQLSIIESNFETLVSQITILFEKADSNLSEKINDEFYDISEKMQSIVTEKLEGYKYIIETTFDDLQKKAEVQTEYLQDRIVNLNSVLKSIWEEQGKENIKEIDRIADRLRDVIQSNINSAEIDYTSLKERISDFVGEVAQNNKDLTENVKSQIDDITKYLDSVLELQTQEISAKNDGVTLAITSACEDIEALKIIANDSKVILDNIDVSIDQKIGSLKGLITELSTNELSTVEAYIDSLKEQIDLQAQIINTGKDTITEALKKELKIISGDIEKETDAVIAELLEQFNAVRQSQQDDVINISNRVEEVIASKLYDSIDDLKGYLDLKANDNTISLKLDNLSGEISKELSDLSNNVSQMLDCGVFNSAMSDFRLANEIMVNAAADKINERIESFISENIKTIGGILVEDTKKIEDKLALFDKKFTDTVVDKYEEIKLISNKYNSAFGEIQGYLNDLSAEFQGTKDDIAAKVDQLSCVIKDSVESTNSEIAKLSDAFNSLRSQISSKSFDEAFQSSINKQIAGIENLINEQFGYIEDISEICTTSLPDISELSALVKGTMSDSVKRLADKIDSQDIEGTILNELKQLKSELITQFLNIFNQISFASEQEEIIDFIQEKHDELIGVLSNIVSSTDKINIIKSDIAHLNEKINSIISSEGDIDYIYSLQDLESDIANLRLALNEMKEYAESHEFSVLVDSTNNIYKLVESIKTDLPSKEDYKVMADDIVSISTRTNKLLLSSDESYKMLQDNLQDFKLVMSDLDERTRNFAKESGMDKVNAKLSALNEMVQNGSKTTQVFNQVFEYLAEWVDDASVQINTIADKVESLDEIGQIKDILIDLKNGSEENASDAEIAEAISSVFEKQNKKMSSIETKLDKLIVSDTIKNSNSEASAIEKTLNKFLLAMDEKFTAQQDKINALETALENVMNMLDEKDTAQLTKKVGGMDRQIAKLNKSIEKIASHVVEK